MPANGDIQQRPWSSVVVSDRQLGTAAADGGGQRQRRMVVDDGGGRSSRSMEKELIDIK